MSGDKVEWAHDLFNQIETQVQFGDSKASLLVAGDAILLAIGGAVIQWIAGCERPLAAGCARIDASLALVAAVVGTAMLLAALGIALGASMPSWKHWHPPRQFFLFSHIATLAPEDVAKWYTASSHDDMVVEALKTVHGKAKYARRKFRLLTAAVFTTMGGLVALGVAAVAHVVARLLGGGLPPG